MDKLEFVLRNNKIKQVEILDKSWQLAIEQEQSGKKGGLFDRGILKQNLYKIVAGRCNPTIKTLQKIAICINLILEDRGHDDITYTAGDLIGKVD